MSMLRIHETAREAAAVLIHEVLSAYKADGTRVFLLFEGRDDPSFYCGLLRTQLPSGMREWYRVAGRRSRVLQVHSGLDWSRLDPRIVLFFVDRDLTDYVIEAKLGDNVYVTDEYSVENYLVTEDACERVLREIYGLVNSTDAEMTELRNRFRSAVDEFCFRIAPLMAWYAVCRLCRMKPTMDAVRLETLCSVRRAVLEWSPSFDDAALIDAAEDHTDVRLPIEESGRVGEIALAIRSRQPVSTCVRGKWLAWLFLRFAESVVAEWKTLCPSLPSEPRRHLELGRTNFVEVVGPRATCPESLKSFVKRNVGEFMKRDCVRLFEAQEEWQ